MAFIGVHEAELQVGFNAYAHWGIADLIEIYYLFLPYSQ
jgi:hypothetical protein